MADPRLSRRLVGASLPRSGHHHLERLLGAVLGDQLRYCEYYVPTGCCRSVPCTRVGASITFQKNHDFDGTLPKDLAGCHYVVQHREPVGGALSDRELYVRQHNAELAHDEAEHERWLAQRAVQHVAFVRKWVHDPPPVATVLDYAALRSDPAGAVLQLLADIPWPHDAAVVRRSVEVHAADTAHDAHHREGDPLDRPGYHPVLVPRFESLVCDQLGATGPRRLGVAAWAGTPMGVLYEVEVALGEPGADLEALRRQLDAALAADPGHSGLLWERGLVAQRAGETAREWFERASAASPGNPRLLLDVANARSEDGDQRGWVDALDAVARLRPWMPEHHVQVATAWASVDERERAVEAILAALGTDDTLDRLTPFPPELWRELATLADRIGEPAAAAEARRRGHARWPEHADRI